MAGHGGQGEARSDDDREIVEQGAFTEINIVPLVDIMLVLLVILMATSTAMLEAGQGEGSGFRVNLPTGSRSDETTALGDQLVVTVLREGEIIARGEQISLAELEDIFRDEAQKRSDRVVLVQADQEALHRRVVEVMEAARRAGLSNLAIATRPGE